MQTLVQTAKHLAIESIYVTSPGGSNPQPRQNSDMQDFATREHLGNVRDKIAKNIDLGSGEQYRKAKYIYENGNDEIIKQLDDGQFHQARVDYRLF